MIRYRFRRTVLVGCVVTLAGYPPPSTAQLSPADAIKTFQTADGLEVTLFAAEPDLRNPTAIDVDAHGRVWVTEAANYRLFNQEIADPAGDRIRVLEDTDGDGRCDKAWTYYQDESLQAPMGIAVLGDRVYVCQSPDLFYLRDTDGDGRADEKTVVLTGFKGVDNDHAIHGVVFGPDGMLYMSNGDRGLDVTDKEGNRIRAGNDAPHEAATVLRTDLEGNRLELLADNMRNPYEPAVNSFGTLFISDNDDDGNEQTRINYVMEGGDYGYWPRRKGDRRLDAVHWNEDRPGTVPKMIRTGFGSPTGLLVYEGTALGERYVGSLIHADAGPGEIRAFKPIADGAGYRATKEILLSSSDSWFRPSDVCVAPDGSLFVADWYDPGVGGHRMADTTQGRIYRISAEGKEHSAPPIDLNTPRGRIDALLSPNIARRFLGHQAVKERPGEALVLLFQSDPVTRARGLWLLPDGRWIEEARKRVENDPSPRMRTLLVRVLARRGLDGIKLAEPALDDPDPRMRRQLLLELAHVPLDAADWVPDWLNRLQLAYDGNDRFYREACGIAMRGREAWAFEQLHRAHKDGAWDLRMAGLAFQYHPPEAFDPALAAMEQPGAPTEVRLLALRTIDAIGGERAGKVLTTVAGGHGFAPLRDEAMRLLARDRGDAWRAALQDAEFHEHIEGLLLDPQLRADTLAFIGEAQIAALASAVTHLATNSRSNDERLAALHTLRRLGPRVESEGSSATPKSLEPLIRNENSLIAFTALEAVASFRGDASDAILRRVIESSELSREMRVVAASRLARSEAGTALLLLVVEDDALPGDLLLPVSDLLHTSRYDDIRSKAEKLLPRESFRDGTTLPTLAELANMQGSVARGRAVFVNEATTQCARCHVVDGEGGEIGPDLSRIGEKLSRTALYEAVLAPDAAISPEYVAWVVETRDGEAHTGYARSENGSELELMDSDGIPKSIRKADIADRYPMDVSIMPSGVAAALTAQELADLVAYLEAQR